MRAIGKLAIGKWARRAMSKTARPNAHRASQREPTTSQDDLRLAMFAGLLLAMMLSNDFTAEVEGRGLTSEGSGLATVVEEADVSFRGFFVSRAGSGPAI